MNQKEINRALKKMYCDLVDIELLAMRIDEAERNLEAKIRNLVELTEIEEQYDNNRSKTESKFDDNAHKRIHKNTNTENCGESGVQSKHTL